MGHVAKEAAGVVQRNGEAQQTPGRRILEFQLPEIDLNRLLDRKTRQHRQVQLHRLTRSLEPGDVAHRKGVAAVLVQPQE